MTATRYVFARDVDRSEWPALRRSFRRGETVRRMSDQFGLCRDDMMLGGFETVPCTEDGEFVFTVPVSMLTTPDGKSVHGDYG